MDWFFNLMRTLDFNDIASGSALPCLAVSDLKNIDVEVPPRDEQKAIEGLLRCLDDKIQLNRAPQVVQEMRSIFHNVNKAAGSSEAWLSR